LLDLGLLNILEHRGRDFSPLRSHGVAILRRDRMRKLQADQAVRDFPVELLVLDAYIADFVEATQNLRVRLKSQGAQKHRAIKFSLAVDPDVQKILVVVLEL